MFYFSCGKIITSVIFLTKCQNLVLFLRFYK
nr:MAG TPA: hypothetical protein [Caudoviricetes sp.]